MPWRIDNDKLQEKYETIWSTIEDFENIELDALSFDDGIYTKSEIRTYVDKVYIDYCGLNVPENGVECETFPVIDSFDAKKYLLLFLFLFILWNAIKRPSKSKS